MYKRRRKAKYIWLPVRFQPHPDVPDELPTTAINGSIVIEPDDSVQLQLAPLLIDGTLEESNLDPLATGNVTIADIVQSNEYFIKRIVGRFFAGIRQNPPLTSTRPSAALLVAGMFVARADGGNDIVPATSSGGVFHNFDPAHPDTCREPWIWRRSWILGNYFGSPSPVSNSGSGEGTYSFFPQNNTQYQDGVNSGTIVDAKTARRVKSDERLFIAISARQWPPSEEGGTSPGTSTFIDFTWDFRALGQLRRARSRGVF